MRLRIRLSLDRAASLPADPLHELQGLIYRLLGVSDGDFAHFLHEEGYGVPGEGSKRLKLFVYSGLRAAPGRRRVSQGRLLLAPGLVDWLIASPRTDFLTHSATGLLATGSRLEIAGASFQVECVEALATPEFGETTAFTCLTPIVASAALADGRTYYLRPSDGEAFSEAARANLLRKYALLNGDAPLEDDRLTLTFDAAYLADPARRGGTKLVTFKNTQIVGAFAPFTLSGSTELMRLAWACGLGEKNSAGFGMIAHN